MKNLSGFLFFCILFIGCKKSSNDAQPTPNPCSGVSIAVNATTSNVTSCSSNNGSISASATGSTGFTYSINATTFQASGNFTGLAAGNFTITAKDANGCTGTTSATVGTSTANITLTPSVSAVVPCSTPANNGSLSVAASGGTSPYTYSFNGGAFSANATLNNQATGTVTVQAKDANGCTSSNITVTIGTATAGPLFTAVKNIINSRCGGCHTGGGSSGGTNFDSDCGIVSKASRIHTRTVIQANMPSSGPIPANERQAITNWINAGAQFNQ